MDDKFRLVFADLNQTPDAAAYLAQDALAFDRLGEAVLRAGATQIVWCVPFIAHRHLVLEPALIALLYDELFNPKSCGSTPDNPC